VNSESLIVNRDQDVAPLVQCGGSAAIRAVRLCLTARQSLILRLCLRKRRSLKPDCQVTESHRLSARKAAKPQSGKLTPKDVASSHWRRHFLFTIYDSLLLLQLIGSDRSAFAEPAVRGWQSKTKESSRCSIHNEGLREHPIKS
jgi:hypothetical protein